MTPKSTQNKCSGCGSTDKSSPRDANNLCGQCSAISDALQQDPKIIRKIINNNNLNITLCSNAGSAEQTTGADILPDVLDAVRFRTRDRDMNRWYVSISEIDGQPVEIFASTAFDRDHHLQSRISNLTTITRLISLILRHVFLGEVLTLEKILKQLHRSSRQPNDLPEMLGNILSKYSKAYNSQKAADREECK